MTSVLSDTSDFPYYNQIPLSPYSLAQSGHFKDPDIRPDVCLKSGGLVTLAMPHYYGKSRRREIRSPTARSSLCSSLFGADGCSRSCLYRDDHVGKRTRIIYHALKPRQSLMYHH
ncbi:hypothetical protein AVEN_41980-1 [Araneus ventricosus]|uniref:Uncharacterized protein n=1 Tax=Araneus ventricosus TaxID=182803 RepID=A0A4Y2RP86_ARAVE|nr:hypothetical protein AVEN_41980-1 [Araneus ventricosus]